MEKTNPDETKKIREGFVFYKSFYNALNNITSPKEFKKTVEILCDFAIYGEKPNKDDLLSKGRIVWELAYPLLNADRIRYLNGIKGGRTKRT